MTMVGSGPPQQGLPPVAASSRAPNLLAEASAALSARERAAAREQEEQEAKKARIAQVLRSAVEIVGEDKSDESFSELERAIEAAQAVGVLPHVRVRARKLLADRASTQKRTQQLEDNLARVTHRVLHLLEEEDLPTQCQPDLLEARDTSSSDFFSFPGGAVAAMPPNVERWRRQAGFALRQLGQAIADAKWQGGVGEEVINEAQTLLQRLGDARQRDDAAESALHQLLTIDDPEELQGKLQIVCNKHEVYHPAAQRALAEVEDRVRQLSLRAHNLRWLHEEVDKAGERMDLFRLRQLVSQAQLLELPIPPPILALLHEMEDFHSERSAPGGVLSTRESKSDPAAGLEAVGRRERRAHSERMQAYMARRREALETVLTHAEDDPRLHNIDAARQTLADARKLKVPDEEVNAMERRVARLEEKHGERLRAEERLLFILRSPAVVELAAVRGEDGMEDEECLLPVLRSATQVAALRDALGSARRAGASQELVEAGDALMSRTLELEAQQRQAANQLRNALHGRLKTESELHALQQAVEDARACGISTRHAERILERESTDMVLREVAVAELREARKGHGPQGRERLQAAINAATNAGVGARKLRAATSRLTELEQHDRRCRLLAGDLRRTLPSLEAEPWRFEQLMEAAKALQPWTPELQHEVKLGQEAVDSRTTTRTKGRELQAELQAVLQLAANRAEGKSGAETTSEVEATLGRLLPLARKAAASGGGVREELLKEAESQYRAAKRGAYQRGAAEHRLRLALSTKDRGELEKSLRDVEANGGLSGKAQNAALGAQGSTVTTARAASARSERSNAPPSSARLIDAANEMMRHLGDVAARRQAAEASLHQHLADHRTRTSDDSQDEDRLALEKDLSSAIQEAKHAGVAHSLIEHAKLKLRQRRRDRQEESEAVSALEKCLRKKDPPTQELIRHVSRVDRLRKKQIGRAHV